MLNVIIFLVGALIMFYMALRSVRARQLLRTKASLWRQREAVRFRAGTAQLICLS